MNKLPLSKRVQNLKMLCEVIAMLESLMRRELSGWIGEGYKKRQS